MTCYHASEPSPEVCVCVPDCRCRDKSSGNCPKAEAVVIEAPSTFAPFLEVTSPARVPPPPPPQTTAPVEVPSVRRQLIAPCPHALKPQPKDWQHCDCSILCECRRPGLPCEIKREVGVKLDHGKARLELLQFRALAAVGRVLTFGAVKYAPDNWRKVDGLQRRYLGAALRHVFEFATGKRTDEESGEHVLAHAACCILFVLEDVLTKEEGK